jgi:hypothetical protein
LSKFNLKIYNKVKGLTKDQLKEYIHILKDSTNKFPEEYFNQILSMRKTEQLRAIKDIVLSLNSEIIEESFQTYQSILVETSIDMETPAFYQVNDIGNLKDILYTIETNTKSKEISHIIINGIKSFLKYHALQLPEYMVNELLRDTFSVNVNPTQEINDEIKYVHELLGLDFLKETLLDFFNQMDPELRTIILTGFYLWEKFENKIIEEFKRSNEYLFLPEEDIGTFELEIYNSLVSILKGKISHFSSYLDVYRLIEKIYIIAKNSSLFIEPWKDYLYG